MKRSDATLLVEFGALLPGGTRVRMPEVCIPSVIRMTKFGWHESWIGLVNVVPSVSVAPL
ncbi:MAG: hypothetical protein DME11_13225 [Candidatus Rokuibacteriota bacterium]|nr:MAG: hypothetical protein DME11_13225 [Candidatus Rokubacteria bacterium]